MEISPGGARDYETPVDDVVFDLVIWVRERGSWVEYDYALRGCDVLAAIDYARVHTPADGQYELRVAYHDVSTGNGMSVWLAGATPEELSGEPVRYHRLT